MCHIASSTVRVGTASCRQCITSAGRNDGLRRHCVGSVSSRRFASAVRCVASAYIGADDQLTSAALQFVDFSRTAAGQQRGYRNRND